MIASGLIEKWDEKTLAARNAINLRWNVEVEKHPNPIPWEDIKKLHEQEIAKYKDGRTNMFKNNNICTFYQMNSILNFLESVATHYLNNTADRVTLTWTFRGSFMRWYKILEDYHVNINKTKEYDAWIPIKILYKEWSRKDWEDWKPGRP